MGEQIGQRRAVESGKSRGAAGIEQGAKNDFKVAGGREVFDVMGDRPVALVAEEIALQAGVENGEDRRDREVADQRYDRTQPDQPLIETRQPPYKTAAHAGGGTTARTGERILRDHLGPAGDPMLKMLRYSL